MEFLQCAVSAFLGFAAGWMAYRNPEKKETEKEDESENECASMTPMFSFPENGFSKEEKWKCFMDDDYGRKCQKCCNGCGHLLREPVSTLGYGEVNSHRWHCRELDNAVIDETVSPIGVVTRPAACPYPSKPV